MMKDDIQWVKTHCSRMDHGGCGLIVGVQAGKIVRITGDPEGFLNKGYVCLKGKATGEKLTHPDRLRTPLRRIGARGDGKWEEVSWDVALDIVASGLESARREFGARSVAFCQGMPKGMDHFALIRLANLFGSPNVVAAQDVCHAPREVTGGHTCGFYPVADLHSPTKTILVWGGNPLLTNEEGLIGRNLTDRLKEGAALIVVDPLKTTLAARADHWLQIRPGSDAALALSFLQVIIDETLHDQLFVDQWCHGFPELAAHVRDFTPERTAPLTGIDPDAVRAAARCYGTSRPGALAWGNAVEQTPEAFDTIRSLVCLMAICGNLDVPGGNTAPAEPPILGLGPFVRAKMIPQKSREMLHAYHGTIPRLMTVPPTCFKKAVLEHTPYPVRAAYIQCTNPMLTWADAPETRRALMALDFFAVTEVFMTPTAALADVVLPAATAMEFNDIGHYGLGHGYILARPKVVDPPAQCRSDIDIITALGQRLTDPGQWPETGEGLLEEILKPAGLNFERFSEKGHLQGPETCKKYINGGFKTATGKVELVLSRAGDFGLPALPTFNAQIASNTDYPLWLTTGKPAHYLLSSYRWIPSLRKQTPVPEVLLHPETAATHGIVNGDSLFIETASGSIRQTARVTPDIRPDTVHVANGWWFPEDGPASLYGWEKSNLNRLTTTTTIGKAFCTPRLRGLQCRIRKAKDV